MILSVTFAIVFCVLFFDDRGTLKELKDEVKSLQGENLNLKQVNERLGSEGKGSRDQLPLDADLIAEAVKFNGYVPVKGEDSVSFMVQGERYFITTDRLPYTIVVKQYGIDQSKYDTDLMRLAAEQTGRDDFAVIENEAVALIQVLQNIKKVTVLDPYIGPASVFVFISVYNKKPGGITFLCRLLCY